MPQADHHLGLTLSDLATRPNDPKMQLRIAVGLYEISDLNTLLNTILDVILTVTGMDRGYLMLGERGKLSFPAARTKEKQNLDAEQFSFSQTIVHQVLDFKKLYYSRGMEPSFISDSAKILQLKTILCIPLIIREPDAEPKALGVIYADSRRLLRKYSTEQLELFGILAGHGAMAIENARLYQLATMDHLTQLPLRHYVLNQLRTEWSRSKRHDHSLSVAMIDIDHFKRLNDRHGHLAGDRALRTISAVMKEAIRSEDLLGRYGGEEFLLMLPDTGKTGAITITNRLRESVALLKMETLKFRITISAGVATFPEHEKEDLEALLMKADSALYRAKEKGRNRVCSY